MRRSQGMAPQASPLVERTAAYLVDSIVTAAIWGGIVLWMTGGSIDTASWEHATRQIAAMLFLVIPFGYFSLLEGAWSTTPGKRLFGLSVVGNGDETAGWYKATVRNVLRLAWSLGPLGPLFLIVDVGLVQWTERDRRLGDHAAKTRVLRTRSPLAPGLTRSG